MTPTTISAWLLTYLVHSTVLLGTAWAVSRALDDRRLALQETLLRLALIGGLLTTGLQLGLDVQPLAGQFQMITNGVAEASGSSTQTLPIPGSVEAATLSDGASTPGGQPAWPVILLALWATGSALGLLGLGRSMLDLHRLLETRRFRPVGRIVERLVTTMGLRREVRLSTS